MAEELRYAGRVSGMHVYDVAFDCPKCDDTGFISTFHEDRPHKRYATVCGCRASLTRATHFTRGPREGQPIPVFGEKEWHRRD